MDKDGDEDELHFGTLIPFKNHDEGLKSFSYNVRTFTTEPAPRHFVEALETVMKDETLTPDRQTHWALWKRGRSMTKLGR